MYARYSVSILIEQIVEFDMIGQWDINADSLKRLITLENHKSILFACKYYISCLNLSKKQTLTKQKNNYIILISFSDWHSHWRQFSP